MMRGWDTHRARAAGRERDRSYQEQYRSLSIWESDYSDAPLWLVINEALGEAGTALFLCPHAQWSGRVSSGQG